MPRTSLLRVTANLSQTHGKIKAKVGAGGGAAKTGHLKTKKQAAGLIALSGRGRTPCPARRGRGSGGPFSPAPWAAGALFGLFFARKNPKNP